MVLKNILVSEESLTELVCLVCGAVGRPHNSTGCNVDLSLIDSYKKSDDRKHISPLVNGSRCDRVNSSSDFSQASSGNLDNNDKFSNSDKGMCKTSLNIVPENQTCSTGVPEVQSSSKDHEAQSFSTNSYEIHSSADSSKVQSFSRENQLKSRDSNEMKTSPEVRDMQSSSGDRKIPPLSTNTHDGESSSAGAMDSGPSDTSGQKVRPEKINKGNLGTDQTEQTASNFVRLQGCESEKLRIMVTDYDLFDEAILIQRRPVNTTVKSSAPCVYPEVPNSHIFNQCDDTIQCRCNSFPRMTCCKYNIILHYYFS